MSSFFYFLAVVIGFIALPELACAKEIILPYRTARLSAMGGTFVSTVEDESSVFLNPAGLATNDRMALIPLDLYAEGAVEAYTRYAEYSALLSNFSVASLASLMGKNISARAQATAFLSLKNFTAAAIYDVQTAFYGQNKIYPQITIGYQNTQGAQVGYGFAFKKQHRNSKLSSEFRVGASVKLLSRTGSYQVWTPYQILALSNSLAAFKGQIAGTTDTGMGGDIGLQYIHPLTKDWTVRGGAVVLDVGNTRFGGRTDNQNLQNIAFGSSVKYQPSEFYIQLAIDYQNLLLATDPLQKMHVGIDTGVSALSGQIGVNQSYLTFGGSIDLWLVRTSVAYYGQELGTASRQNGIQRLAIQAALKLPL